MDLSGELSTSHPGVDPGSEGRRAPRADVVLGAGLRQRGAHAVTVQIVDLSTDGFRAATHLELFPGSDIWLKLPGLESLHARVVWMHGHMLGAQFVRPLHPAVLDMVVRTAGGR